MRRTARALVVPLVTVAIAARCTGGGWPLTDGTNYSFCVKVADSGVIEQIKAHMPEIKNGVLLLLSSKTPEEIASLDGKNQLRGEIRDVVNRPLGIGGARDGEPGKAHAAEDKPIKLAAAEGVVDVLLTSFVIQ